MPEAICTLDIPRFLDRLLPLASEYGAATGRSLGITGEVGELIACEKLGWTLAGHLQAGWDATAPDGRRIQIKSRCLRPGRDPSPTMPRVRLDQDWDSVALVLMDAEYRVTEILESTRADFEPLQRARGDAGVSISKFRSVSWQAWSPSPTSGREDLTSPPTPNPRKTMTFDELTSELRDEYALGRDQGNASARAVAFGARHADRLGRDGDFSVKTVVEAAGLTSGVGIKIDLGRSISGFVEAPIRAHPAEPEDPTGVSILDLSRSLRDLFGNQEFDANKTATIFFFGIQWAADMKANHGQEMMVLRMAEITADNVTNLRLAQQVARLVDIKDAWEV